jgi:hypothetical protein
MDRRCGDKKSKLNFVTGARAESHTHKRWGQQILKKLKKERRYRDKINQKKYFFRKNTRTENDPNFARPLFQNA